jgi:hypothetical protein
MTERNNLMGEDLALLVECVIEQTDPHAQPPPNHPHLPDPNGGGSRNAF